MQADIFTIFQQGDEMKDQNSNRYKPGTQFAIGILRYWHGKSLRGFSSANCSLFRKYFFTSSNETYKLPSKVIMYFTSIKG